METHLTYENVNFYGSWPYLDLIIVVIVGKSLQFGSGKWFWKIDDINGVWYICLYICIFIYMKLHKFIT